MTGHERVELRRQLASDVDSLVALVWPMVEAAFMAGGGEARKEAALDAYADARALAESRHHWTDEIRAAGKALEAAKELERAASDADEVTLDACRGAMMALWAKSRKAGSSA